jgi:hypothetical protein
MVEHCDRCGTALPEEDPRHQRFVMEDAADSAETMEGRLCSDCFWEFEQWLQER